MNKKQKKERQRGNKKMKKAIFLFLIVALAGVFSGCAAQTQLFGPPQNHPLLRPLQKPQQRAVATPVATAPSSSAIVAAMREVIEDPRHQLCAEGKLPALQGVGKEVEKKFFNPQAENLYRTARPFYAETFRQGAKAQGCIPAGTPVAAKKGNRYAEHFVTTGFRDISNLIPVGNTPSEALVAPKAVVATVPPPSPQQAVAQVAIPATTTTMSVLERLDVLEYRVDILEERMAILEERLLEDEEWIATVSQFYAEYQRCAGAPDPAGFQGFLRKVTRTAVRYAGVVAGLATANPLIGAGVGIGGSVLADMMQTGDPECISLEGAFQQALNGYAAGYLRKLDANKASKSSWGRGNSPSSEGNGPSGGSWEGN